MSLMLRNTLLISAAFAFAACGPSSPADDGGGDTRPADSATDTARDAPTDNGADVHADVVDAGLAVDGSDVIIDATADIGPTDGSPVDSGPADVGPADGGLLDVGPADVGPLDTGPADTGPMDTGPADVGPPDTGPADTGPADTGPIDAGTADAGMCPGVVDLNTAGTLTAGRLDYLGDNSMAPVTGAVAPMCGSPGYEVVLAYTVRANSLLRVSLVNPGTAVDFDTVMSVRTSCTTTGTQLGCNDDTGGGERRSSLTTPAVTAGETVYVVVAGYHPSTGAPWVDHGPFELTVIEVTTVPVGGTCDPTGATNVCATGSTCTTAGGASTCVADGALGGACNTTTPACNAGLGCNATMHCVTVVATGATCDPTGATNVCATGSSCTTVAGASTCVADGALGGACRTTTPACNTGLGCNSAMHCATVAASGGMCDTAGVTPICPSGDECVGTGATGTCHGFTESALAAPTWVDACATGTHIADLSARDDGHGAPLTIPFTLSFFGTGYTQLTPDTNGYIQLGAAGPSDANTSPLPIGGEGPVLAPFYDDLVVNPAPAGDICYLTVGTGAAQQFVVEWMGTTRFGHVTVNLAFEVVLHNTTNLIDFVYHTLSSTPADAAYANGSMAGIGLQGDDSTTVVVHSGTVTAGHGLRFTPSP